VAAPKYQVFVSSTYEDLRTEREQVIRAVLEMGHIPVGMEMFSAADEEQWQIIARHIDESDYYVVVVAHRYGSLTDEGLSYTQKEYEYARDKGIPCLGFVIDAAAAWPADRVDKVTGMKSRLDAFKDRIREKPVGFWSSADDLYGKVSIALTKTMTAQPREGWVRASSVVGVAATAELIRLSAENAELRKRIEAAEKAAAAEHKAEIRETIDALFRTKKTLSYRYVPAGEWQDDVEKDLFDLFRVIAPELVVEASIKDLARLLAMHIRSDKENPRWDVVAVNQVKTLMTDFMTLDLAAPSTRRHAVSDVSEYWSLSPFGVEILKRIRKVTILETDADTSATKADSPADDADAGASATRSQNHESREPSPTPSVGSD
jgi:Domain of unknown function (DUF4062)